MLDVWTLLYFQDLDQLVFRKMDLGCFQDLDFFVGFGFFLDFFRIWTLTLDLDFSLDFQDLDLNVGFGFQFGFLRIWIRMSGFGFGFFL